HRGQLAGRARGRRAPRRSVNRREGHGTMCAMALLERDAPLAALLGALDAAAAGRGSTVLVSGEAGIGKTSLVRAFAAAAGERARVLQASCDDLATPRTLGPLHDALGPLDDDVLTAVLDRLVEVEPTVLVI